MPKGKKLTYKQREIMAANGIKDCTDWRYIKQIQKEDGSDHLTPTGVKSTYMVVENITTGEKQNILIS